MRNHHLSSACFSFDHFDAEAHPATPNQARHNETAKDSVRFMASISVEATPGHVGHETGIPRPGVARGRGGRVL